ncbi:MAG: VCBS repeat-containing protein [Tepidisphaeraceae bacterium]
MLRTLTIAGVAACLLGSVPPARAQQLEPLKFNHPGLVVDLGVGLWATPMPMDYDRDGDLDLVVVSPDKPSNGIYFFENPGGAQKLPVFKPGVRVEKAQHDFQISYVDGKPRILRPGEEWVDFHKGGTTSKVKLPVASKDVHVAKGRLRGNLWSYVDFDGDGIQDLVVGIGDWTDYGWDDAFNEKGEWTNGPLRGFVYVLRNTGTNDKPSYAPAQRLEAGGKPIDQYGSPAPSFADFDGDGDLDLVCGEFLDKLTYYENQGSRTEPRYAAGAYLSHDGKPIVMDLEMIQPVAIDWDGDGDADLIVGQEDGRVALVENTGMKSAEGAPAFLPPVFFKQVADDVKYGSLATPVSSDWDGDGDLDLIVGNAAGYIGFIENLGGNPPKWAAPKDLEADGKVIRILAGENGSIQGPCEAKWGYTTLSVADWDHDGLADLVVNSIWGKVEWYRNIGTKSAPKLTSAAPIEVAWAGAAPKPEWNWWKPAGNALATQWRTTPVVADLNRDGLNDLVMLDRDGFLSLFERKRVDGRLQLMPPRHALRVAVGDASVFDHNHKPVTFDTDQDGQNDLAALGKDGSLTFYHTKPTTPGPAGFVPNKRADRSSDLVYETEGIASEPALRLTGGWAGRSGRRKLCVADWDGDGRLDVLVNSTNINFLCNVSAANDAYVFKDMGQLDERVLAGHDTSPSTTDWDGNGVLDLIVGAENGVIYYLKNARPSSASPQVKAHASP